MPGTGKSECKGRDRSVGPQHSARVVAQKDAGEVSAVETEPATLH